MPDLKCIPPDQHDQGWALLCGMVIAVIDEVKNSIVSTDINDSIEDVNDFLVMVSAAAAVNSLDLSSAEIADREIKTWKTLSQGQESSRRVALRCCTSFPLVGSLCIFSLGWVCWGGVYLLFLQLQQLPSACFPRRVT